MPRWVTWKIPGVAAERGGKPHRRDLITLAAANFAKTAAAVEAVTVAATAGLPSPRHVYQLEYQNY